MSSCLFYYSRGTEARPHSVAQDGFKITAIISPLPPECWVTAWTTLPSSFYDVMLGVGTQSPVHAGEALCHRAAPQPTFTPCFMMTKHCSALKFLKSQDHLKLIS